MLAKDTKYATLKAGKLWYLNGVRIEVIGVARFSVGFVYICKLLEQVYYGNGKIRHQIGDELEVLESCIVPDDAFISLSKEIRILLFAGKNNKEIFDLFKDKFSEEIVMFAIVGAKILK